MEHIINLGVQAVILTYSQSHFYDPENPSAHVPDVNATYWDVVGLIRSIAVKVNCTLAVSRYALTLLLHWQQHTSSKRKDLFMNVQKDAGINPTQLMVDMPVRWSSTLNMLTHAIEKVKVRFIH